MLDLYKISAAVLLVLAGLTLEAQPETDLRGDLRSMSKETDPQKCVAIKRRLIAQYHIDSLQDASPVDMMNGIIAVAYALQRRDPEFQTYIGLVKNKFNQTSMLEMSAVRLLDDSIDAGYACKIAKQTLDVFHAYKNDPAAKPADAPQDEWDRFMKLASYPYNDTYARALFAVKRYKEALEYQRMAFDGAVEGGLPASIERYARLLALNGEKDAAKEVLLKSAGKGNLSMAMIEQLKDFYIAEGGTAAGFQPYLDSLQAGIRAESLKKLAAEMLDETAPPFSLKNLLGKTVRLADYKGKIVILDLWATWCAPCIASFPAMQKMVEKHRDVVFLFIAVQEGKNAHEKAKKFMAKNKYPFQVLIDEPVTAGSETYRITSAYKPTGIPAKYFIDQQGKLRFKKEGFATEGALMNEVDNVIAVLKGPYKPENRTE